jgi:cytochrome c oxidase subunit 1
MGWLGMPRRYYDYLPEYSIYHKISTVGSWILVTGLIIIFYNLIKSIKSGPKISEKNIWGGETLEWKIETPPIHENFHEIPIIDAAPYEYKMNDEVLEEEEVK